MPNLGLKSTVSNPKSTFREPQGERYGKSSRDSTVRPEQSRRTNIEEPLQTSKERLDLALVRRGLVESRSQAQALILAGRVEVAGRVSNKAGALVSPEVSIHLIQAPRYVSRGGEKLEAALDHFDILVKERVCVDVGSSTGGFTDCLLQRGAERVYAVDVGRYQLHEKLRRDPRVILFEKTHILHLRPDLLEPPPSLATIDVSFISLTRVFSKVISLLLPRGVVLALIKPQFEVGPSGAPKGVVRDPKVHEEVLERLQKEAQEQGLKVQGLFPSPLLGPKGNREFFLYGIKPT